MRYFFFIIVVCVFVSCEYDRHQHTVPADFREYIDSLMEVGELEMAMDTLDYCLDFYPENCMLLSDYASVKYMIAENNNVRDAETRGDVITHFKRAHDLCPSKAYILGNLIETHYYFYQYDSVVVLSNDYLNTFGSNQAVLTRLADSYSELGDAESTLKYANKAIEMDTAAEFPYILKSYALLDMKRYEEALNASSTAVKLNPSNSLAHHQIGVCYDHLNDYTNAISHCSESWSIDRNRVLSLCGLVNTHHKMGELDSTCRYYQELVSYNYDHWNKRALAEVQRILEKYADLCTD